MRCRTLLLASTLTVLSAAGAAQDLEDSPALAPPVPVSGDQPDDRREAEPLSVQTDPSTDLQVAQQTSTVGSEPPDFVRHAVGRMPAVEGHTGLLHLDTADSVPPQTLTLGLFGEYFTASDVVRQGDDNRRFTGRLDVTYTFTEYLEAFASLRGQGNVNNLAEPNLIQTQGDLSLGLKGFTRLATGLTGGLALALTFTNGENSIGFDFDATSANFRGLLSYSLQEVAETPLLIHVNIGYLLDNSANLFEIDLQRVERFAHQVSNYDLVEFGLGLEVPLAYVTPLLEWRLGLPIGGSDLDCELADIPCPWDVGPLSFPHMLTLGIKGTPVDRLALSLGLDIGLTTEEATGLPAQPPYNLIFGVAYLLDPTPDLAVQAPIQPVEPQAPETGWILGEVVSQETTEPIAGAIVSYPNTDLTAQSTDPVTGRFRSYEFPANTEVAVEISHPAYQTRSFTRLVPVGEDGIRIRLEPGQHFGILTGRVFDPADSPLPATIYLSGPQQVQFDVDPLTSEYERQIDIGRYIITVVADGHVSQRSGIEVGPGTMEYDVTLTPLPPGQVAVLRGDRIDLSGESIAFADSSEELEPETRGILDQVVELLQQYPEIYLRVVAHTDDTGTLELTERQAQAVVDFLVGQGVDPLRLQPEGRGSDEPLFPNISRRNRMRNRRVEFLFLE